MEVVNEQGETETVTVTYGDVGLRGREVEALGRSEYVIIIEVEC